MGATFVGFSSASYGGKKTTTGAAIAAPEQVKLVRAHGGCLGTRSRRRTWRTTKCLGEP